MSAAICDLGEWMMQELELAFVKFAAAQLAAVRARVEKNGVVERPFIYKKFRGGKVISAIRSKKNYPAVLPSPGDSDFPNELADDCANHLIDSGLYPTSGFSDRDGKPIANPTRDVVLPFARSDIMRIVWTVLGKHSIEANEEQFRVAFSAVVDLWARKAESTKVVVPLLYFNSEVNEACLAGGFKIQKASDNQRTEIWNSFHYLENYLLDREFANIEHFIVADASSLADRALVEYIDSVISALRLIKPGAVGTPGIFTAPNSPASMFLGGFMPRADLDTPATRKLFPSTDALRILNTDIPAFEETVHLLQANKFENFRRLHLPISRFNKSYVRDDDSDKIIDLCIALESSLLHDQDNELSYRLALRGAALLSTLRDPEKTFQFIRVLYEVRSQIVHKGVIFPSERHSKTIKQKLNMTSSEFVGRVEEIVREIIRNLLAQVSMGKSLESVCQELDAKILHDMQRKGSDLDAKPASTSAVDARHSNETS